MPVSSGAKIGDYVTFGKYEQDNNTENDMEDIEWLVLDIQGDKALLISKYGLDCKPYNEDLMFVTWETCTLRKWLNNEFINNAFDMSERNKILTSEVTAKDNERYGTDAGDKIFLLSINEVDEYFASDDERKCSATDYAIGKGAYTSDSYTTGGRATCWWWLRSLGYDSSDSYDHAAYVKYDGTVDVRGIPMIGCSSTIRPALWVNLNS